MLVKNIVFSLLATLCCATGMAQIKSLGVTDSASMRGYFVHSKEKIISGHRGSHIADYPENAIETFEYVLKHTPAFFEIDPRLTKDSVIVLMHDATLDRTTNGTGRLADYTLAEVKKLRLKDRNGKITDYQVPTLQEAIDWARGKTVINLDKKDVPLQMTADIIKKNDAAGYVMVTVHASEQASFYREQIPSIMMSAFVKTAAAFNSYEQAGIPWSSMIAYIGSENKPENKVMYDLLHAKGVKCMISAAPKYDKLGSKDERAAAYRSIFEMGADILESDYPVEVAEAIGSAR